MKQIREWLYENRKGFYAFFRVVVGLLFAQHGAQKLFGRLGGSAAAFPNFMFWIGIIEFFGGLLVAVGFLTRTAAFFSLANMVGAQIKVHLPQGFVPIQNGGELSLMFLVSFLLILVYGARKWSIETALWRKN
ncbi:MAG: DoxX family protein [Candidatus Nanohaloarchaea archaeon]|nr:DoxX family protein [Candidatus Nanohaloarchaea archaeon]